MKAAKGLGLWLALAWLPCAHAIDFEFQVPPDASDANVAAVMRDLAGRILPVYHDDDQERYLSSLSALQLVAGHFAAADGTRQALRERRQESPDSKARADARAALLDLYAHARTIEAEEHVPFAQAFERAFGETVPKLDDQDAYAVTGWPGVRADSLQETLQHALDRVRGRDQVDQAEALRLVWTYLAYDIESSAGSLLDRLGVDDDRRRYILEEVTIRTASGATLHARVVRPKNAARRGPALLEFASLASANDASAGAAHGYAGIVAATRGKKHEGEDARAVIAWIARQPWSDGHVGMFGHDDGAGAAWAAAKRRPRALKVVAIEDAPAPGIDFRKSPVTIPVLSMAGCTHDTGMLLDESPAPDLRELRFLWFDHVLKGAAAVTSPPPCVHVRP